MTAPHPIAEETISRACLLFLQGRTVRSLASQFEIPRSTLHYRMVKRLGKGCHRNDSGTISIIEEHLQSPFLTRNQKLSVRRWVAANMQRLVKLDSERPARLLTARKEQALTREECGSICDFRANLNRGHGGNYVA